MAIYTSALSRLRSHRDPNITPEAEASLLGRVGRTAVGGIAAVGNVLDLPGSFVRDVAVGENPIDQFLPWNWTTSENRTTGREVLRKYDLAGGRDTWGNFGAGLGLEIAMDPLTYLTLGGSALSKGGKIARAAGLMDDATRVAARKAGVQAGQIGKRQARVTTTLGDLIESGGDAARRSAEAAAGGPLTDDLLTQPLGGLVGVGLPFRAPKAVYGTGARAAKAAEFLDTVGSGIRHARVPGTDLQPINELARLFDARIKETRTPLGQLAAKNLARREEAVRASARQKIASYANRLKKEGLASNEHADMLRDLFEKTVLRGDKAALRSLYNLSDEVGLGIDDVLMEVDQELGKMVPEAQKIGLNLQALIDDDVEYFPRKLGEGLQKMLGTKAQPFSTFDPSKMKRLDFLRNMPTSTIRKIAKDEEVNALIAAKGDLKDLRNLIRNKFTDVPEENVEGLASFMARISPDTRKMGVFGNHPLIDLQSRLISYGDSMAAGNAVLDTLTEPDVLKFGDQISGEKLITVKQLINNLGMVKGDLEKGAGKELTERLMKNLPADNPGVAMYGTDISKMDPEDAEGLINLVMDAKVDAGLSEDLQRFIKSYQYPEPTNKILSAIDSLTNLFKAAVTSPWPAFQVRNLFSGQFQNFIAGFFDPQSVMDAHQMMRGNVVDNLAKIPAIQTMHMRSQLGANYARVAKQAEEVFGEEARTFMPIAEARAFTWAQETGNKADDWFARIQEIRRGDAAPPGALTQPSYYDIGHSSPDAHVWMIDENGKFLSKRVGDLEGTALPSGEVLRGHGDAFPDQYKTAKFLGRIDPESKQISFARGTGFTPSPSGIKQRERFISNLKRQYPDYEIISESGDELFQSGRTPQAQFKETSDGIEVYINNSKEPAGKVLFFDAPNDANAARRVLPQSGIKPGDEIYRIGGIELQDAYRGQGIGQRMYLNMAGSRPNAWFYNSQSEEPATRALEALANKGYIELHWSRRGANHAFRITDAGKRYLRQSVEGDELFQSGRTVKTNEEIANATSRTAGAVGPRAVVPRIAREVIQPGDRVLDYGAGKDAAHAMKLREEGVDITAHEMGKNIKRGVHDLQALAPGRQYEVVYASNVLNVQGTKESVARAIEEMAEHTAPHGRVIVNLPNEPRYGAWSRNKEFLKKKPSAAEKAKAQVDDFAYLESELKKQFQDVTRRGNVFYAGRPISDQVASSEMVEPVRRLLSESQGPVPVARLREVAKLPKEEFDQLMMDMARKDKVQLFQHDFPGSLREEELGQLVKYTDPTTGKSTYYNAAFSRGLTQQNKGAVNFLDDGRAIITAFESADISTLAHETAHIFRRDLPEDLLKQAEEALGVSGSNWTREAEEKFASGFERYLRDGKAPTKALEKVFSTFRDWLTRIYRSLTGTPLADQVNPKLRDVFDKALGKGRPPFPGLDNTRATELLGEMIYAHDVLGRFTGEASEVAGQTLEGGGMQDILLETMGPGTKHVSAKRMARKFAGREPGTNLKPWDVRGVGGRVESGFGPVAAGQDLGHYIEGINRVSPFIHQLRKGVDPAEAAAKVGAAQVQYGNRHYTKTELQVLQRLFPFMKFSKAQIPFTLRMLTEQPGGKLAQTLRGINRSRDPEDLTPDYVAETASVPLEGVPFLGNAPEGTQRYLTGLGLMFEDPLSFIGAGPQGAGLEALSRLNPLLKGPLEWSTGQSFFQKGPLGGRPLHELDPSLGRTLANVTGQEDAVTFPGSEALEFILGNSPLARALTSVRTATDPRKNLATRAVNLGTGLRISDVSPASQDAILRERAQELMRQMGAKQFTRTYFPDEGMAEMTPEQQVAARELEALMNMLAKRAKARKEAQEK